MQEKGSWRAAAGILHRRLPPVSCEQLTDIIAVCQLLELLTSLIALLLFDRGFGRD
jgi:hypothetical protein